MCKSRDPKDNRFRSSALVKYGDITILVDCGPDFRIQMLREDVKHLDAVLLTHSHKDHTGGMDDLRSFNLLEHKPFDHLLRLGGKLPKNRISVLLSMHGFRG